MSKLIITQENAQKIKEWVTSRGGVNVWKSIDFSDLSKQWLTPANVKEKPHWKSDNTPAYIVTDINDITVSIDKEVKRFKVAIRRSTNGLSLKCTDTSTKKIRNAVEQAGEGAYYEFDYGTKEAIILAPEKTIPLAEFN